ncbi:hypothetical protein CULT_250016 [[Clostridium] ultunense Esp]|nr:hypothetical protein CULT_250016 [[Clostridium] ultunense Esp]
MNVGIVILLLYTIGLLGIAIMLHSKIKKVYPILQRQIVL